MTVSERGVSGCSPRAVARWCAAQGWPVHPLSRGTKTPARNCASCRGGGHPPAECPCRAAGRWCHGFHAATTDRARIDGWWSEDRFGVGVACGPAGLVVIDIDAHGGPLPARERLLPGIGIPADLDLTGLTSGFHSLAVLAALHGERSPAFDEHTLRVRTPSGGLHVWYRTAPERRWLCSVGSGRGRALAWQVDVRAHGGYIVAPGTVTRTGAYTALGSCRKPAPLPQWLAGELTRTGHAVAAAPVRRPAAVTVPARRPAPSRRKSGYAGRDGAVPVLAGVLGDLAACASAPAGTGFTERLNRAAYTVGGLVAAGRLDPDVAERALAEAAARVRPGQTERARRIIAGGLAAGRTRPLHAGGRA
ncbi:bifunctional DNA primase/polymerase [Streptomyces sp. NPDC001594]|uniref:bifunctional DNA primase/polymerase n=1 Tax=Streptomyces sp. NPDC001594 TaxID=3364590 RepID=UPI0036C5E83E